jgi:hypothetical protein
MATAAELRRLREEQSIFAPLYEAARQQQSELAAQGRRPVFGGLLSKEPVYGTDTLRYEGIGNMLAGLLSPAAKAVDAPISAYRGTIPQEDMISEALGVGGLAMAGGGAVGVPRGAVGANAADLRRQANIDRFGYDPNEAPEVDTSYRGGHQPAGPQDENPVRLDDVTISTTGEQAGYPSDFYSGQGQRLYAQGPRFADDEFGLSNQQSYRAIQAARGNPDAEVTIYRGVPNEESITSINAGDFVTLSPKYAELHASSGYGPRGEDAGKVISQKVKVKDVYFAGDDVNEFGYFPDTTAANASKSAGLLTTAASEAQDMAKRILDLRAQGRASEVTDEMMAQADPQYMFANTPLPMDEASRIARAEAAGFENQTYYHGAKDTPELPYFDRIDEYNTEGHAGTIYGTSSPAVANTYVRRSNIGIDEGAIYPLLARRDPNDPTINVGGVYSRIPMSIRDEKGQRLIDVLPEAAEMDHLNAERVTSTDAIASAMRDADFSMLRMENVVDRGPYYPDATPLGFEVRSYKDIERQNDFNKWNKETLAEASEPATNIMVQDPTKLRSRFARFDPEFSHLSNLSAANVSPIGGLLAQSGANQQSGPVAPNLIDEYLKSLQARR